VLHIFGLSRNIFCSEQGWQPTARTGTNNRQKSLSVSTWRLTWVNEASIQPTQVRRGILGFAVTLAFITSVDRE